MKWSVNLFSTLINKSYELSLAPPPPLSQDFDVTQELVLRHHASVSELKRLFMEDLPVFGPTEWDRRLSSYTPVVYPKLPNGELFTGIDIVSLTHLKH